MLPLPQKQVTFDDEVPSATVTPTGDSHSQSSDSDSDHSILDHFEHWEIPSEHWEIPSENDEHAILPKSSCLVGTGIGFHHYQRHTSASPRLKIAAKSVVAALRLADHPHKFRSYSLDRVVSKEAIDQIDRDLPRTGRDPLVQSNLGRIRALLLRHVAEDPELGYCQGMNYVAAAFAVVAESQEEAYNRFYLFTRRLRNLWMPGTFSAFGCFETGMQQFKMLAQDRAWYRHLVSLDVQASMYLPQAWLTIFVKWLPLEAFKTCLSFLERHGFVGLLATTLVVLDGVEAQLLNQTCMDDALRVLGKLKEIAPTPQVLYDRAKTQLSKVQVALDKMQDDPRPPQNMNDPCVVENSFAEWFDASSHMFKRVGKEALAAGRAALLEGFAKDETSSRTITLKKVQSI
jgi:hypothetical protein